MSPRKKKTEISKLSRKKKKVEKRNMVTHIEHFKLPWQDIRHPDRFEVQITQTAYYIVR